MRCITFILSVYLTGCVTAPNPEKYLELTCENLSDLSSAYSDNISQYKLFNDDDINEWGRTNKRQEDERTIGNGLTPIDLEVREELRSIRAAAVMNGC